MDWIKGLKPQFPRTAVFGPEVRTARYLAPSSIKEIAQLKTCLYHLAHLKWTKLYGPNYNMPPSI